MTKPGNLEAASGTMLEDTTRGVPQKAKLTGAYLSQKSKHTQMFACHA